MVTPPIRRVYGDFKGVDFANDPSLVLLSRSPDALNVWKNYNDTQGGCIESRPGYKRLLNYGAGQINGIHFYNNKIIFHLDTFLMQLDEETLVSGTTLKSDMNNARSTFCIFQGKLYIVDGANYLVYDGTTIKNVSDDNPFVPTTSISRSPSGGGEFYQDVNVLTPLRKNTFVADGTSTDYRLDVQKVNTVTVTEVKVNGTVYQDTQYTVVESTGEDKTVIVRFNTAPASPVLAGVDNVEITFEKNVPGYSTRISKCTKMVLFDNRLFFSGNPDYPNGIFHCQLNTPNYVSDLAYYQDGTDESAIKSIVVGNNTLWVFKEPSQEKDTIFYHTATTDTIGRVYPNFHGNISVGCCAEAINYKDDIVFLTKTGLEGISSNDISSQQLLTHKSTLVDNKLINEEDLEKAIMTEWNGYLVILINSHIYLGDKRQAWQGTNGYEYEWYYWDLEMDINVLKEYQGNLYFGGQQQGAIYILQGSNDNVDETHTALEEEGVTNTIHIANAWSDLSVGTYIRIGKTPYFDEVTARHRQITAITSEIVGNVKRYIVTFDGSPVKINYGDYICREDGIINAYWTTPMDNFGLGNKYKTTNKRGGVAKIKTIPNGKVKVAEKTNKTAEEKLIKEYASGGFDFENLDFGNFEFSTELISNIVYKIKEKKFIEIQLKFYTDELDKPFGLYDSMIEAFEGGYVKR